MMERKAKAIWEGKLQEGRGSLRSESGMLEGNYSAPSRFQEGTGTNPEELIGAAHAGCYSMALAHLLEEAGFTPKRIETEAIVRLASENGEYAIPQITLRTQVQVPEISDEDFHQHAEQAKDGCPVSKALAGPRITLEAELIR